jgi:hypothetical protein
VLVEHRRAGTVPARRDRRRHLQDQRRHRSCLASGLSAEYAYSSERRSADAGSIASAEDQATSSKDNSCLKGH